MRTIIIDEFGRHVPAELYALRMQQQAQQPQSAAFSTADVDPARVQAALDSRTNRVILHQRQSQPTDTPQGRAWLESVSENALQMKVTRTGVHSTQAVFVDGHYDLN